MYPVHIDFKDKKCLIVGAGKTAKRRADMLKYCGAEIWIVAPEPCPEYFTDIHYISKEYEEADIAGMFMVFASTDNTQLNERIVGDARKQGILAASVTKCSICDVSIPAVHIDSNLTLSVSTSGISPALSSELCREAGRYIKKYDGILSIHEHIRSELLGRGVSTENRREIMKKLSSEAMRCLYCIGGKDSFFKIAEAICGGQLKRKARDKKAVLMVSFGTSYENTREKTIGAVENRVREAFRDCDVFRAFTSGMIIKKLRSCGMYIDTVAEALAKLYFMGYSKVYCQPTHIIPGEEYEKLCRITDTFSDVFDILVTGKPLLSETSDYSEITDVLDKELKSEKDTAVVFMGHGTEHTANSVYPALQFWFWKKGYIDAYIGTVEGYPQLSDVIELLNKKIYKKILLLPFMLVAGDHAQNDMAGDKDSWKNILTEQGYIVRTELKGLGEYRGIQDMYVKHIKDMMS